MHTTTTKRFFAQSKAALVHQDGSLLSTPSVGVEIILHMRPDEQNPCCAELISANHHAEIGLSFTGKELSDCDGVFFLPREVGEMLKDVGYVVPEEFFA